MKEFVRTILDYPVKGIQFRDITSLLQNSKHFEKVIDLMTEPWKDKKIDAIVVKNNNQSLNIMELADLINKSFFLYIGKPSNSKIVAPDERAPTSQFHIIHPQVVK